MANLPDIYVKIKVSGRPTEMDDIGCQGMFIESTDIVTILAHTIQSRISTWATETFGQEAHGQRMTGVYNHLIREINELDITLGTVGAAEELADCAILLFELATFHGVDLLTEVEGKFAINKARKWGDIEEDGSILHIKEDNDEDSN